MKYAITGSNGFIAKHLIKELKGDIWHIPRKLLYDYSLLKYAMEIDKPDVIIHTAAYGNMSNHTNDQEIFNANLVALWTMLSATKDISYESFINISTSSVNLAHQTIYSATKKGGQDLCQGFADAYKKPIYTLRPYSVYGEGEADYRFIPTVFRSCLNGKAMNLVTDATHDWIHVSDIVKGILFMIKYQVGLDLGTGTATTNLEVVRQIEKLTHKKARFKEVSLLRSFDTNDWVAPVKIFKTIPLKEGLKLYYESIK